MDIAIIGAGSVGTALATALARSGHRVVVASRDPEDASALALAAGARLASSNAEAAAAADVVILALPATAYPTVAAEIRDVVTGRIVVDVSNRMSYGESGPDIDTTSSNAEELARQLPGARIVKAFNTLFATHQGDPTQDGVQLDGFVAGDDRSARRTVLDLVEAIGLRPVDVGPLARARQLEGLAFLNIALNVANGGGWTSGWKLVGAPIPVDDRAA